MVVVCTSLEQMFKHMVTDLDTQAMMTKQRLMCVQCACQFFLISLVACRKSKGWTQNLTSVCTIVKSTSAWNTSPGSNSSTFTSHMVTEGKHRGFITSIFRTECFQIIVCSLLSTVAYEKLVHLQWTGRAQGEDSQFTHCSFTALWEESIHKQPRGWSRGQCESFFVEHCMRAGAPSFPLAEDAGSTRPH